MNRIKELDQKISTISSQKEKKIAIQTRNMLIKTRSTGNNSISDTDRIYLTLHIDNNDNIPHYLYYFRHITISELLQQIIPLYQKEKGITNNIIYTISLTV